MSTLARNSFCYLLSRAAITGPAHPTVRSSLVTSELPTCALCSCLRTLPVLLLNQMDDRWQPHYTGASPWDHTIWGIRSTFDQSSASPSIQRPVGPTHNAMPQRTIVPQNDILFFVTMSIYILRLQRWAHQPSR